MAKVTRRGGDSGRVNAVKLEQQPAPLDPKEPNLHQKAMETLNYLEAAHEEAARLDENLFGRGEEKANKAPNPVSVEGVLARCSELAAMLVGRLATMNRQAGTSKHSGSAIKAEGRST